MINLIFQASMQVFMISINQGKVFYNDSKVGVQELYPNPSELAIRMGGVPTEEELKEYNLCKTDEELAAFCLRDARKKGCRLVRKDIK